MDANIRYEIFEGSVSVSAIGACASLGQTKTNDRIDTSGFRFSENCLSAENTRLAARVFLRFSPSLGTSRVFV